MGEETKENENDDGDGKEDEVKDKAQQYVNSFSAKAYDEESDEEDEPKLEILVSCAELAGIFDPIHNVQYPFVEVYADDEEIGETMVASDAIDGKATEESSTRPVWNQSFIVRPDGTRYYRFRVCIEYIVRQRKIVGEAGFAAADAWKAVGKQSGPVALNVQLVHKGVVSGILHLVLGRYKPHRTKQAEEAVQKSIEFYMQQAGAVDEKWKSFEWMELLPQARTDWSILGWTRDSWTKNRPPESEFTAWADLTDEERFAAMRLGYDIIQWDGVEQISNAAASLAAAQYNWYTWQPEDLIKLARHSSLHRAHPYIGRDFHSTNNPPPILDVFPEDPSHRHEQIGKGRAPMYQRQGDGFEQVKEIEDAYKAGEEDDDAHLYMFDDIWNQVVGGFSFDDDEAPCDDDIVYLKPDIVEPPIDMPSSMVNNGIAEPAYRPTPIPNAFPTAFQSSQFHVNNYSSSQANLISQGRIIPASGIRSDASLQPSYFAQPLAEPRSAVQRQPPQFVQPSSQQLAESPPSNIQVYPSSQLDGRYIPQSSIGTYIPPSSIRTEASLQTSQPLKPMSQQLAGGSMEEGRYIPPSSIRSDAFRQPSQLGQSGMAGDRFVQAPPTARSQTMSLSNFAPVPSALQTRPFETQSQPVPWSNFDPVPSAFETAPLEARPSVSSSLNVPVQTAPRLVGTTPMSSSAPPKVLTSMSRVPQQIVEESFGSVADQNLDTLA